MADIKQVLAQLDLGKSVAEFDESLEKYFVETGVFRALVQDKVDVVAGDKGTGKTAIYRILQKRYKSIPAMRGVEFLPAFNPSGNPVFQKLTEREVLSEGEYIRLWKAYLLSLVGNWVLHALEGFHSDNMKALDHLLKGLSLRERSDQPQSIFARALEKIGGIFHWNSAQITMTLSESGIPIITPKVEFDHTSSKNAEVESVSVEHALRLLNTCVEEAGVTAWIAIDRLDEAFQGYPTVEIPALRALFRTYLDLQEFPALKLKLFVRRDLFRRITDAGFVNLTHVNARKIEVI